MPEFRPLPPGATGPRRTVAPSTSREAAEDSLPRDITPRANKPIVRKTPTPRPRGFHHNVSIDSWEIDPDYIADDLGFPR